MDDEALKLEKQLCFPLYVAAKEIVKLYKPFLKDIELTYTQYITMMVLWEVDSITVKDLGRRLHLDSGTLTPLLKRLEAKGYLKRIRSQEDERLVNINLTDEGEGLKKVASQIPSKLANCLDLSAQDAEDLYRLLYKIISK